MSKIIAVTGATGSQGGGVVNVMKNTPGWKVRAITRNVDSVAAKKLAAEGIEVVSASFDDESSLVAAFEVSLAADKIVIRRKEAFSLNTDAAISGVSAVFAVTNWWEHLFSGKTQEESSSLEEDQGMRLARAAAQTATLEHYIWSSCPTTKKLLNGELSVPHMDAKAEVDERIKSELPELAKKTTYLFFGYYPQNLLYFPLIKPIEYPPTGYHVQILPTNPDAKVLLSGDMKTNPGIWVRQALLSAPKSFGRCANVALEKWTFRQMMDVWSEVTGKKGLVIQCRHDDYEKIWGPAGREIALQFQFGEKCDPWVETDEHISPEELGIDPKEVVGFRETIEGLKQFF